MKTNFLTLFVLFLSFSGCDKRCESFVGMWETENYNAYVNIVRNGDIYWVSIKNKTGEEDWFSKQAYLMYYDNGMLRSDTMAFKTITFNTKNHTLHINNEEAEWKRVPNKGEM